MRDHADSALGTERAWDFRRVQVLGARSCSTAGRPAVPLAFSTGGRPAWPHGLRAGADSGVHRGDSLAPGATARDAMGRDVLKRVTAESRWHVVCAVTRLLTATPRPGLGRVGVRTRLLGALGFGLGGSCGAWARQLAKVEPHRRRRHGLRRAHRGSTAWSQPLHPVIGFPRQCWCCSAVVGLLVPSNR